MSCECLQQLVRYFRVFCVVIFFHDIHCHECRFFNPLQLQSTPSCGGFRWIDLPNVILSTLFPSARLSSNTVKKKVFICWLFKLFKYAKKNDNNWDALRTHFTPAYWWLDTLPTMVNFCYYHSHFWAATLDFKTSLCCLFCMGRTFFYSLAVLYKFHFFL